MELVNVQLYSFMEGIFGPEVLDLFDIDYDIEGTRQALLAKREAIREEKEREAGKNAEPGTAGKTS